MHSDRPGRQNIFYLLPLLFLALFYFYPLASVLKLGFMPAGRIDLSSLVQISRRSFYWQTFWFTLWQAIVSTALTLLLALPGAYIFARFQFRGQTLLKAMSTLPFVLPTVVVANAFTALLGPRGLVNAWAMGLFDLVQPPIRLERTVWLILLAHVFYNYSVALRIISGFWQHLNPDLERAALMLGATPRRAFWHVTRPLLRPAVLAAAALVFIFTFTSFGVILILGGPGFATLEVEIYRQAVNLFNLPVAAALSLLQILFTFVLMWLYTRAQASMSRPLQLRARRATRRKPTTTSDYLLVGGNLLLMGLLLGMPLLALVARSFVTESGISWTYYRRLMINERGSIFFVPPATAIFNSLTFALATVLVAVTLGLLAALLLTHRKRQLSGAGFKSMGPAQSIMNRILSWLDPIFMLPLATSAVTLGFGYIVALNRPPLNLRDSLVLVPIAHALVGLPFVMRSVLPALRSISPRLREAAVMLGADPGQVWWSIDWPLIRRALLVGAVFAFTISMGEFGATVFIARPETPTMPVAIFRFLSQPGAVNYGRALAMSSLLMLVCAAGFVAIERFRIGDEGEF